MKFHFEKEAIARMKDIEKFHDELDDYIASIEVVISTLTNIFEKDRKWSIGKTERKPRVEKIRKASEKLSALLAEVSDYKTSYEDNEYIDVDYGSQHYICFGMNISSDFKRNYTNTELWNLKLELDDLSAGCRFALEMLAQEGKPKTLKRSVIENCIQRYRSYFNEFPAYSPDSPFIEFMEIVLTESELMTADQDGRDHIKDIIIDLKRAAGQLDGG